MEQSIGKREFSLKAVLLAATVMGLAFAMLVIAYGVEPVSILQGAHDAFHDFRHTIGMPCH